jgi:hypothetical protein
LSQVAPSIDPEWFLKKSRLLFLVTELRDPLRYEVRFQRAVDKSTISYIMRTQHPPTLDQAMTELQWLFTVTDHGARTWNRLVGFFTEEEVELLKKPPQAGLDALASASTRGSHASEEETSSQAD